VTTEQSSFRFRWIAFAIVALVGTASFFVPAFIIRPFTHQSVKGLYWAMAIRQHAPLVSLLSWIACLPFAFAHWRSAPRWGKVTVATIMVIATLSAVVSRLNYFEWMFHPVQSARFDSASASKLDKNEMIMAVRFGSDARAYPIREMAYHHILNDVVEGVPIAVTY
jgi:hypothetical protein